MTIIKLLAMDQALSFDVEPKLAAGDQNSVQLHVEFSTEWLGYSKSAAFYTSIDSTVYEIVLNDGKCVVPYEVLEKPCQLYIGIRGVNANNNAVKTSCLIKCKIIEGAPVGDAVPSEPTPDVYQQILTAYGEVSTELKKVGSEIDNLEVGVDKALAAKIDKAAISGYSNSQATDEEGLNAWLENTVIPSMAKDTCKHIVFRCGAICSWLLMGTIYKNTDDFAVIDVVEHLTGQHFTKVKKYSWLDTVPTDLIYTSGNIFSYRFMTKEKDASKFYVVEVTNQVNNQKDTIVVNVYTTGEGTLRYTRPFYFHFQDNLYHDTYQLTVTKLANGSVVFEMENSYCQLFRITGYA